MIWGWVIFLLPNGHVLGKLMELSLRMWQIIEALFGSPVIHVIY